MFISAIVSALVSLAVSIFFPVHPAALQPAALQPAALGNETNPVAGVSYTLAGSGISGSATSIILTSLTIPQTGYKLLDADFSNTFYLTLEPGNRTRQEIASCTTVTQNANGTATLSGCARGLLPYSPFTASTTYQFAHGGGTAVVFSNPPQLYEEFAARGNTAQISGVWSFASSSLPRASTTPTYGAGDELKFATYGVLASTSFSGTVDSSLTQKGVVEIATPSELAAGTSAGETGAPLVARSTSFNATSTATTTVPVALTNGTSLAKLDPGFINTSSTYAWNGTSTFGGGEFRSSVSSTFSSTTTFSGTVFGVDQLIAASSTTVSSLSSTATATLMSVTIPANTLIGANAIEAELFFSDTELNGPSQGSTSTFEATYGGTIFASSSLVVGASEQGRGYLKLQLFAQGSSSLQFGSMLYDFFHQNIAPPSATTSSSLPIAKGYAFGTSAVNATQNQTLAVTNKNGASNGGLGFVINRYIVRKIVAQ